MPASSERLRVVVIDDSSICRTSLAVVLEADGDIEVVGEAEDGFAALALVQKLAPDVVTMDIQMPGKNGLEVVEQIMTCAPVPILVVTAMPLGADDHDNIAFKAIDNGALDVFPKPSLTDDAAGVDLRVRIREIAKMPVFLRADPEAKATTPPPRRA